MGTQETSKRRVVVPKCHYFLGNVILIAAFITLWFLDARASDFGTIASALGLYSAALLGVFSVLTAWRSSITKRKNRYLQVEDKWRVVIDRSVLFALRGSALSFMLMLLGVIAPAIKNQLYELLGHEPYAFIARTISAIAIVGVILLGMMSLQIVRDITAVYEWNNVVEEQDARTEAQRRKLS
ncbi:hypothetical protein [Corynebacterium glutamicum]|uniref:hypothetical protein n=1 Tax=Corynebacterium glutamicum TaxID=1718 RepID=UPI001467D8DC|nr:hypothetical protein [Corynebacterium glutamicum]GFK17955.1 hypothetical protein KbCgl_05270 [Corynebacterium glutamicum]